MARILFIVLLFLTSFLCGFSQSRSTGIYEVSIIELAGDGNVWSGSNGNGVSVFNPGTLVTDTFNGATTPQLKNDTITAILCSALDSSYVFVGSKNGLAIRKGLSTWDTIGHVSGQQITGLLMTAGDTLWVLTADSGAYIFDHTGQTFYGAFPSRIPSDSISTVQRGSISCGSYTVGTDQLGAFYTADGITYSVLDTSIAGKQLVDNRVTAVSMKNDCSAMFIGTMGGYSSCPPGLPCTNFTVDSGLPQNHITAVAEDCNGKVWLGTHDSGVIVYNPRINATSKFSSGTNTGDINILNRSSDGLTKGNDGLMYGNDTYDGIYSAGMFFWYNPVTGDGGTYQFDTIFNDGNLWNPVGNPAARDSSIWGVTLSGGGPGLGTLYRYYPTLPNPYPILTAPFDTSTGSPPVGLIAASNGYLYGVTSGDKSYPFGTIFKYDKGPPSRLTRAAAFDSVNTGAHPDGNLTQGSDGRIYGTTPVGGVNNKGTLFQFDTVTKKLSVLYSFKGAPDGEHPSGSVIRASNSLLYGTCQKGGKYNGGILFSFDSASGTLTNLYEFDTSTSPTPVYLYQSHNGMFYGLTTGNNGTLFQFNRYNGLLNTEYQFTGNDAHNIGTVPYALMAENPQGSVFGRTTMGALYGYGSVFRFNPKYAEFTTYTTANGLPSNKVTAIAFDPNNCNEKGYIGTADGSITAVDTAGNVTALSIAEPILFTRAGVYLYPQPASSQVQFVFSRTISDGTLYITDLFGRRLQQYEMNNQSITVADVSKLSSGIYFFYVSNEDQVLASGKISVMK